MIASAFQFPFFDNEEFLVYFLALWQSLLYYQNQSKKAENMQGRITLNISGR